MYVYESAETGELVPPAAVTATWTAPEVCAGVTAVICVCELTV